MKRGPFLGRTGIEVSRLCLGAMTFGWTANTDVSHKIMDAAVDAGITFFDTANMYSRWVEGNSGGDSEAIIGDWLRQRGGRERVQIATKVRARMWDGPNGEGLNRVHILRAVEDSLRRLNTDYIDLYQTHWFDEHTPVEETLAALDTLVRDGKVRAVGASNHPAWRLTKALWQSDVNQLVRYETLQPHYNLLHRVEFEAELRDLCADQHISVIPYSPLAAGLLAGKYTRDNWQNQSGGFSSRAQGYVKGDKTFDVVEAVADIADGHGVPPAQVALAWLLAQPTITAPIFGARTVEQVEGVAGALRLRLTDDEVRHLNGISSP